MQQFICVLFLIILNSSLVLAKSTLWSFDGPLAIELQAYLQQNYSQKTQTHLFSQEDIKTHIQNQTDLDFTDFWKCVSNQSQCDVRTLVFEKLGIKQRIFAYAEVNGKVHKIRFTVDQPNKKLVYYESQGDDLADASKAILGQLFKLGRLKVEVKPKDAKVWIDGALVKKAYQGIDLAAGTHTIKIKKSAYKDYTEEIMIRSNKVRTYKIRLESLFADFKLLLPSQYDEKEFTVYLDQEPIEVNRILKIAVGEHQVTVKSKDYKVFKKTFTIYAGEKQTLNPLLIPKRALWKVKLKTAHGDVRATRNQVYFRLQAGQAHGGAWPMSLNSKSQDPSRTIDALQAQSYPTSLWGFDLGFQWNLSRKSLLGPLRLDLLGISYISNGRDSTVFGKNNQNNNVVSYDLIDLSQFRTRFAWVGYQHAMWRFTPYFDTGLIWVYETAELQAGNERLDVSQHTLRWGWEVGLDFTFTPQWVLKTAMLVDTWPGERTTLQALVGVAYAFNLLRDPF